MTEAEHRVAPTPAGGDAGADDEDKDEDEWEKRTSWRRHPQDPNARTRGRVERKRDTGSVKAGPPWTPLSPPHPHRSGSQTPRAAPTPARGPASWRPPTSSAPLPLCDAHPPIGSGSAFNSPSTATASAWHAPSSSVATLNLRGQGQPTPDSHSRVVGN
jgi:hypothetical protein